MTIIQYIYSAIGILVGGLFAMLLLFEYWKKLWLRSAGEIVEVKVPHHALGRSGGIMITICYRYTYKGQPYAGEELKTLDVEYHREEAVLEELLKQYPVGGKIVVFHP